MNRTLLATLGGLILAGTASAEPVNVAIVLGFTGPLESITPAMAASAELAFKEASDSGGLPGGMIVAPLREDASCVDVTVAEKLVTASTVAAIMGADCSGEAGAKGVAMVAPSAMSPALSIVEDTGFFFRTAPSDARQGTVLAEIATENGVKEVAVTYADNAYGQGLADSFAAAFQANGGTVSISAAHEDGEAGHSAEVAALRASGADTLIVLGYVDQGGRGIVQAALDTGAFEHFYFADGMYGQSLIDAVGPAINGKVVGTLPGVAGAGADAFAALARAAGLDPTGTYVPESYDAAALIALSMAASGSPDRAGIRDRMLDVANAPGEPVFAGELAKGIEILAGGGDIDYHGATGVELIGSGEAAGSYRVYEIRDDAPVTVGYR